MYLSVSLFIQKGNEFKDGLLTTDPRAMCCNDIAGLAIEDMCKTYGSTERLIELATHTDGCTCLDYIYCRLVVVTAFSSNHFDEAQDTIASVQHNLPNTSLIVYDLGLSKAHIQTVSAMCNVQILKFNFDKYMNTAYYVKNLRTYAWKPLIVNEISKDYEVIMYLDSSVRILQPVSHLLQFLQIFPFVSGPYPNVYKHPVISLTHDSTISYLKINLTRAQAVKQQSFTLQGGVFCMWQTKLFRDKFLNNWVDCALHEDCLTPKGSTFDGCNFKMLSEPDHRGEYIGCHRYDQSALNLILYREFGKQVWESLSPEVLREGTERFWVVERTVTHHYQVKSCF